MTLIRPPAYPLWIAWSGKLGLPLRLDIEILYIVSALVFSLALFKAGAPRYLGLAIFWLLLFFPSTFKMHNEVECETLYLPLLLLTAGMMILLISASTLKRGFIFAIGLGLFLAALWHTRHEHLLLEFYLAFFALLFLLAKARKGGSVINSLVHLGIYLVTVVGLVSVSTWVISQKNNAEYGIENTSEIFSPGYVSALNALASIEVQTPKRYASVTEEARRLAYQASPSFRRLQPLLEGDLGQGWRKPSCVNTGLCDDIGSAWFQWALRESADRLGLHSSATQANAFYQSIANEIQAACDNGKISCIHSRFNTFGLLGSGHVGFFKYLTEEILHLGRSLIEFQYFAIERDSPQSVSFEHRELYDRVAHRRQELTSPTPWLFKGYVFVLGWAAHVGSPIREVQLRDMETGTTLGTTREIFERPDVWEHLVKSDWKDAPKNSGFSLEAFRKEKDSGAAILAFISEDGKETLVPLSKEMSKVNDVFYAIDYIQPEPIKTRIKNLFGTTIHWLGLFLLGVSFPALLCLFIFREHIPPHSYLPYTTALIAFMVVVRLGLIAVYSAFVFYVYPQYIRFLYPVAPLFYCGLILLIFQACQVVARWLRAKKFSTSNPSSPERIAETPSARPAHT